MLKRNLEQKKLSGPVHPKETANTTAALYQVHLEVFYPCLLPWLLVGGTIIASDGSIPKLRLNSHS